MRLVAAAWNSAGKMDFSEVKMLMNQRRHSHCRPQSHRPWHSGRKTTRVDSLRLKRAKKKRSMKKLQKLDMKWMLGISSHLSKAQMAANKMNTTSVYCHSILFSSLMVCSVLLQLSAFEKALRLNWLKSYNSQSKTSISRSLELKLQTSKYRKSLKA